MKEMKIVSLQFHVFAIKITPFFSVIPSLQKSNHECSLDNYSPVVIFVVAITIT